MSIWKAVSAALPNVAADVAQTLYNNREADQREERNATLQKEFAQTGIRWRVEDAKAAGLHPLAALGTMPSSFSPISLGDPHPGLSNAGQSVTRALMAQQTPEAKATQEAQLRAINAQADNDLAQAQYWSSKANEVRQPGTGPGIAAESSPVHLSKVEGHPLSYDIVKPKPDEFVSRLKTDPSLTAATHAGWTKREMGTTKDGRKIYLASPEGQSWSEMGDLPLPLKMAAYRRSAELSRMSVPEWLHQITFGIPDPATSVTRFLQKEVEKNQNRPFPEPAYQRYR